MFLSIQFMKVNPLSWRELEFMTDTSTGHQGAMEMMLAGGFGSCCHVVRLYPVFVRVRDLENSLNSSSYCSVCRDVLPFPLQLPEAIAEATTHRQLETISHMGQGTRMEGLISNFSAETEMR